METHEVVKRLDGVLADLERINSSPDLADARGHAAAARHELRRVRIGLNGQHPGQQARG